VAEATDGTPFQNEILQWVDFRLICPHGTIADKFYHALLGEKSTFKI
jgi:hypothetical protein